MPRYATAVTLALSCLASSRTAAAQPAATADPSRKWEITDNSFLVEEAFNQEPGVFQNIFTWTRERDGAWEAAFTQEWPAPNMTHQLSYTVPFGGTDVARGIGDVMLNYRYQLRTESARGPAVSPRLSVILPTSRESGLGSGAAGLQFNLPISKQFGDLYVHANAGQTWLPDVQQTTSVAGSGIWRIRPMVNLMLESVVEFGESVTVSPGVRGGWTLGERQLVVGAAVPFTRADGRSTAAILAYFSYELPFR
jgi:hypothetical protein